MIYLKLIILILVTHTVIKIYFDSKKNYPPLDYQKYSTTNTERWRWRKPDEQLALHLQDEEDSSHLFLSGRLLGYEKLFVVFGYLLMIFAIFALFKRVFQGDIDTTAFIIVSVFFALGYGAISVGKYVSRIVLYRDKIEFIQDFGFFFRSIKTYHRKPRLSFRSEKESFLQLTSDHDYPRTRLYVKDGFIFSKLFNLAGNPSQNFWIVEGLEQWNLEE